ncbi:hypothetical protein [Paenibacillus sedimenti]|nr:hypothetical protein [Paenibacillus sedimenti]
MECEVNGERLFNKQQGRLPASTAAFRVRPAWALSLGLKSRMVKAVVAIA